MKVKAFIFTIAMLLGMSSCSTSKTVLPYFTDISSVESGSMPLGDYATKIVPDDELFISVTTPNPDVSSSFNLLNNSISSRKNFGVSVTPQNQTYVVNTEGDITFPVLGKIHVAGMTIDQLTDYLTERVSAEVTDPIVVVRLVNFVVNVGGEVTEPKRIEVKANRYSILDAISEAGDLTPYGERSNVLLVREADGKREFVHLDLNSSELLSSPYFYLKQNDYIYVEPNRIRQSNSKYNQDNAFKLQVTSTIVSAASVIVSLIIALAIK